MKTSTIWIIVAIVVVIALWLLFKPTTTKAAVPGSNVRPGNNVKTGPNDLNKAVDIFNTIDWSKIKNPFAKNTNTFKQTPPIINGCDFNHVDSNGFLCVEDGNGGWMPSNY